tara:strand:+ start:1270 stop:1479 length:210 start_codon:yes stop_codon:yes gene_type:complete
VIIEKDIRNLLVDFSEDIVLKMNDTLKGIEISESDKNKIMWALNYNLLKAGSESLHKFKVEMDFKGVAI